MWFFKKIEYQVFGFYQFTKDAFVQKDFIEFIIEYFNKNLNIEFKHIAYTDITFRGDNIHELKKGLAKLEKKNWENIICIDLLDKNPLKQLSECHFDIAFVSNPSYLFLKLHKQVNFDIFNFLEKIKETFDPIYGFKYFVSQSVAATSYVYNDTSICLPKMSGVGMVSKQERKSFKLNKIKIKGGYFRDIYLWNLLNKFHLENLINGVKVENFIKDNQLGKLEQISDSTWIWQLNEKEIKQARKIFYNSKLII